MIVLSLASTVAIPAGRIVALEPLTLTWADALTVAHWSSNHEDGQQ